MKLHQTLQTTAVPLLILLTQTTTTHAQSPKSHIHADLVFTGTLKSKTYTTHKRPKTTDYLGLFTFCNTTTIAGTPPKTPCIQTSAEGSEEGSSPPDFELIQNRHYIIFRNTRPPNTHPAPPLRFYFALLCEKLNPKTCLVIDPANAVTAILNGPKAHRYLTTIHDNGSFSYSPNPKDALTLHDFTLRFKHLRNPNTIKTLPIPK